MSFQYNGVTVDKFKKLWPTIVSNLSFKLADDFNASIEQENAADVSNLQTLIRICCDHKPVNFDEYISFVMIATFMELLKFPSTQFHLQSTHLMAHTFNANTEQWYRDEKKVTQILSSAILWINLLILNFVITKVMAVAEAIWTVSSDSSNINHIIIGIHDRNQFTLNVSIVLLIAALGCLTTTAKPNRLPLVKSDAIFNQIGKLDIMKSKREKMVFFDFLYLFQTFQRLISTPAARDDSLRNVLVIQSNQLERIKIQLQALLQSLNKTINDQTDLNENTTISHCIQLILTNMDIVDTNFF